MTRLPIAALLQQQVGGGAPPAIAYVGGDANTSTGTDVDVTLPTLLDDDIILLVVGQSNTGSLTTPTGYTYHTTATNSTLVVNVFTKTAVAADDSGDTVTVTNPGSLNMAAAATVYRNVDSIDDRQTRSDQSGVTTFSAPNGTSLVDDSVHDAAFFERSTSVTDLTNLSDGTERVKAIGSGGGHVSVLVASIDIPTAGAFPQVDIDTVGASASRAVGVSTCLAPAT